MSSTQLLELVVLEGAQAGASTAIRPGSRLSVGTTLDNDIVLRDAELGGTRVEFEVDKDALQLAVTTGEVDLVGRTLVAGEVAELLPYTAMQVGGSTIAYGEPGSTRWQELLAELEGEGGQPLDCNAAACTSGKQLGSQNRGRLMLPLFLGAGLLLALYGSGQSKIAAVNPEQQAVQLTEQIQQLGFPGLQVQIENEGALTIIGYLDELRQRAVLESLLEDQSIVAALKVQVGEKLATEVENIYRVQGIVAEVESLGPKKVKVTTREADTKRLQHVKTVAIEDAGLDEISAHNFAPDVPSVPEQSVDPGQAVTMVVAGEPAYVVTTDRARYFIGALLPTGHRIAAITGTGVLLEKAGLFTTLNF